jgi:hypothetical protein
MVEFFCIEYYEDCAESAAKDAKFKELSPYFYPLASPNLADVENPKAAIHFMPSAK